MTKYKIGFIDEELITFRLHQEQQSNKNRKRKIKDFEILPILILKNINFVLSFKTFFQLIKLILAQKKT